MRSEESLIEELRRHNIVATGDRDWDSAMLDLAKNNVQHVRAGGNVDILHRAALKASNDIAKRINKATNLADPTIYAAHSKLVMFVANNIVLAPQRRTFVVDDDNKQLLRFLLYYFNNCPLAEEVFPDKGYKLHKSLLIQGGVGVGKTLLMQVFSEYLKLTNNPRAFVNVSVTQMVNYYTLHNNLDRYTYNEESSLGFQSKPVNICLNDIGIQDKTYFGMDTSLLTDEFLHARNEIWTQYGSHAHLTTNLDNAQLRKRFGVDPYNRLVDRLKTYNIIYLKGKSRR